MTVCMWVALFSALIVLLIHNEMQTLLNTSNPRFVVSRSQLKHLLGQKHRMSKAAQYHTQSVRV